MNCKDRSEGRIICYTSSVSVAPKRCPPSAVVLRYPFCEVEEDPQKGDPQRLVLVLVAAYHSYINEFIGTMRTSTILLNDLRLSLRDKLACLMYNREMLVRRRMGIDRT